MFLYTQRLPFDVIQDLLETRGLTWQTALRRFGVWFPDSYHDQAL